MIDAIAALRQLLAVVENSMFIAQPGQKEAVTAAREVLAREVKP